MSNAIQSKLSDKQLNRIINRFISKSEYPKPYLTHPYQTSQHTIATNTHSILFLSNSVTDQSLTNSLIDEQGIASLTRLEQSYVSNDTQSNEYMTLDTKLIESIVKSLKQHQKDLHTRKTLTRISYNSKHNEFTFNTIRINDIHSTNDNSSYYRPCSVSDSIQDYTATIQTDFLINALLTQNTTGQHTMIGYDTTKGFIKLSNEVSTIIIMQTK